MSLLIGLTFFLFEFLKGLPIYTVQYRLIGSEDYALVMGSLLLFGVLAFIMVITRDVNWYQIEAGARKYAVNNKKDGAA